MSSKKRRGAIVGMETIKSFPTTKDEFLADIRNNKSMYEDSIDFANRIGLDTAPNVDEAISNIEQEDASNIVEMLKLGKKLYENMTSKKGGGKKPDANIVLDEECLRATIKQLIFIACAVGFSVGVAMWYGGLGVVTTLFTRIGAMVGGSWIIWLFSPFKKWFGEFNKKELSALFLAIFLNSRYCKCLKAKGKPARASWDKSCGSHEKFENGVFSMTSKILNLEFFGLGLGGDAHLKKVKDSNTGTIIKKLLNTFFPEGEDTHKTGIELPGYKLSGKELDTRTQIRRQQEITAHRRKGNPGDQKRITELERDQVKSLESSRPAREHKKRMSLAGHELDAADNAGFLSRMNPWGPLTREQVTEKYNLPTARKRDDDDDDDDRIFPLHIGGARRKTRRKRRKRRKRKKKTRRRKTKKRKSRKTKRKKRRSRRR